MDNHDLKNAGYKMIHIAADAKCWSDQRRQKAIEIYIEQVRKHDEVNAVLVQLLALAALENA